MMPTQIVAFLKRLSLAQRFMLASLFILVFGMLGIGWWVEKQIEVGVVYRSAATTALYVDSFISPLLQELEQTGSLKPEHREALSNLLQDTPLGQQIVAFKVWDQTGRVVYSTDPATIGQVFPMHEGQALSWSGQMSAQISDLEEAENRPQRAIRPQLLEIYSPVRSSGSHRIIAVAEFYQMVDDLQKEVNAARWRSWLVVGVAMLIMYILLAVFVHRTGNTIDRQRIELAHQVARLTELLTQNTELQQRVRRAAASVTTLNERLLRRIGAELHDGPVQDLGLAALQLDAVISRSETCCLSQTEAQQCSVQLTAIETSLQSAMKELRAIAGGLGLPQLAELNLTETVVRVVRAHERRTGTKVALRLDRLPERTSLPVKITLYRLIQEALNNGYRHAGGVGQQVQVCGKGDYLTVEVLDQGPGFELKRVTDWNDHLGLVGMRERVESLGGLFQIESQPEQGTRVTAQLFLQADGGSHER